MSEGEKEEERNLRIADFEMFLPVFVVQSYQDSNLKKVTKLNLSPGDYVSKNT